MDRLSLLSLLEEALNVQLLFVRSQYHLSSCDYDLFDRLEMCLQYLLLDLLQYF